MEPNDRIAGQEFQSAGGIYILTNSATPDFVWIGCSSDAEKKLASLNRSQDLMADLQAPFHLHAVLETNVKVSSTAVFSFIDGINPKLRAFPASEGEDRTIRRPEAFRLSPEGGCNILKAFTTVKGISSNLRIVKPVQEMPVPPASMRTAYVAENPAVPGWIRISVCDGPLEDEMKRLNKAAGLPLPYRLCCSCSVPGSLNEEAFKKLAVYLAPDIVAEGGTPFFRLSPKQATGLLEVAAAFSGMEQTLKIYNSDAQTKKADISPNVPHQPASAQNSAIARMQNMVKKADAGRLEFMMESLLLGLAVGDALGVPHEFKKRNSFKTSGMAEGGAHGQQAGTWSDDASLTLAFADSLRPEGFDAEQAGRNFQDWLFKGMFSARGAVFDVDATTKKAIARMGQGIPPEQAGSTDDRDNGNGSLMRIAPLSLALLDVQEAKARYEAVRQASSLTHAHPLSCGCCFVFEEYCRMLAQGVDRREAYDRLCGQFSNGMPFIDVAVKEKLERIFNGGLAVLPQRQIQSDGYVVHTLEAGLWCLLNAKDYADAVLKAVNLGDDADTTAAVAGAAAGLCWGKDAIPVEWTGHLAGMSTLRRVARESAGRLAAGSAPAADVLQTSAEDERLAPEMHP